MFNKSKKLLCIVLAGVMLICAGCGKSGSSNDLSGAETLVGDSAEEPTKEPTKEPTEESTEAYSEEALAEQERFEQYLLDEFKESAALDTLTLHYTLAYPENFGIEDIETTYGDTDMSDENLAEKKEDDLEDYNIVCGFDYDMLSPEQKHTYNIVKKYLETNIETYDYTYYLEPFAYTSGIHANLPVLLSEYIFYDRDDVDDYIELINLAPDYFNAFLEFEEEKSAQGLFMPTNCANEVIRQCTEFIQNPEENLLIETFNDRIGDVEGLTEEEIESYKQLNHDAVINSMIPAYKQIIKSFKELRSTSKNQQGLAHLEKGRDYYKLLLKNKVGTDMTPEEIAELYDEKIKAAMKELSAKALLNYEDFNEYVEQSTDGTLYKDFDAAETIKYFEEATADLFPEIPTIDFTVSPVHESLQNIVSPAFYVTPPYDEYKQNVIHTNIGENSVNSLWSTLAHEGIPGHMYQFVYFHSINNEPIRQLLDFTGYSEGWATYIELQSYKYYNGYDKEIFAELERINSSLNLLVSARIELGVNYEGWTQEEAADYLVKQGFDGAAAQQLYDYVIAEPVNYQMYVLGWLMFEELKEKAETELGDSFDIREFHKAILDAGPCQFDILEDKVDEYIANEK